MRLLMNYRKRQYPKHLKNTQFLPLPEGITEEDVVENPMFDWWNNHCVKMPIHKKCLKMVLINMLIHIKKLKLI